MYTYTHIASKTLANFQSHPVPQHPAITPPQWPPSLALGGGSYLHPVNDVKIMVTCYKWHGSSERINAYN